MAVITTDADEKFIPALTAASIAIVSKAEVRAVAFTWSTSISARLTCWLTVTSRFVGAVVGPGVGTPKMVGFEVGVRVGAVVVVGV